MHRQERVRDIVYSSSSNGDEDIYVMDRDGRNVRRLTQISKTGETNRTPEWSSDGAEIAFQSNREGPREIYILTLATSAIRRLTFSGSNCNHPAWSPDGKQLIYLSDRGEGARLYVVNADGSDERAVSIQGLEGRSFFNPSWTPDGSRIAFVVQGQDGAPDALWTAAPDGADPVQVSPKDWSVFEYDYSPDGSSIVLDAKVSNESVLGDWDIFVMRSDGTELRRLTESKAMSSRPKWLSDGRTIVFHTNRFGDQYDQPGPEASLDEWFRWWNQFEICTMNADGADVKRLTANQLRDLHPDG